MDSRRAVASASSTVINLVALAAWPLPWFCRISAMPSQLADEELPTMLGFEPGGQWREPWSAQSPAEALSVSLNHHIPITQWVGSLYHLSLHSADWPVRPVLVDATFSSKTGHVLSEEVALLGSTEHCCIGSCLLESMLIKVLVIAHSHLSALGVLLFDCVREVWMFVSVWVSLDKDGKEGVFLMSCFVIVWVVSKIFYEDILLKILLKAEFSRLKSLQGLKKM